MGQTPERTCRTCGTIWRNQGRYDHRLRYCSDACRDALRRNGNKSRRMVIPVGKVVECCDGRLVRVTLDVSGLPDPVMLDMKTFRLYRSEDPSGVSGVGYVAEGVQFTSGKCVLAWTTAVQSIAIYDSMADLMAIHGHDGATRVRWLPELTELK